MYNAGKKKVGEMQEPHHHFLTLFLWELMFWISNKHFKGASGRKSVCYTRVPLLFASLPFFLSLHSLQKRVHCTFSNKKLTSDNELKICHYFMELEKKTLISTAVILRTTASTKMNRTRRKRDESL